jgi:branched-chain amino acid transport system permease protein
MFDAGIIIQLIVSGVIMGSIYALVSGGLSMIYGVMDIINAAHGEYMMAAMYLSVLAYTFFGINPYLSLVLTVPFAFGLGILTFYLLIRPVVNEPPAYPMLVTIGVSILLQNLALFLFSADYRMVNLPYASYNLKFGLFTITLGEFIALAGALPISFGFYWFLMRTDLGRYIRAASEDPEGALLMGINVRRIQAVAFGLGTALLGVAGPLLVPIYYVTPTVGELFLLRAFVIVVLGGMGNFIGALVGGMIIGICEVVGTVFLPGSLSPILSFVIFIGFLLFRPQGIFGAKR